MRPVSNSQGGHELWHLTTNSVLVRRRITSIPITQGVINMVHMLAESDKMPSGLKLVSRHNVVLYDSTWIAGVHNNNNNNDKNYDDEEEENYDDDEYEEESESDMDEIDPNELGDLLEDTNNMLTHEKDQENHNQQMISSSESTEEEDQQESEEEFDQEQEEYQEEENTQEDQQSTTTPSEVQATITRSGRVSRMPVRYQHLQAKSENTEEYTIDNARVLANTICHANYTFIQTYSLTRRHETDT